LILFDDSSDPHIAKVLSFIRKNISHVLVERELMQFRPIGSSDWKYRVARLAGKIQLTAFEKISGAERKWNARFSLS
jgi:hypothetical protein